ncbi:hypothetical protein GCM10011583_72450 [Streptomyces camponoticapitis]|uniref:Uncharacterized protein n=1 Tax=Streptomyces camponoticapitis TaxID=1616125 RepID=A0ABQ2EX27_9ACTN|nr:hypothetical protein GCM10011583_72450 [Streptomyces camponoticapitis]
MAALLGEDGNRQALANFITTSPVPGTSTRRTLSRPAPRLEPAALQANYPRPGQLRNQRGQMSC